MSQEHLLDEGSADGSLERILGALEAGEALDEASVGAWAHQGRRQAEAAVSGLDAVDDTLDDG